MFWIIFCTAVALLYWIYDGYGRFLQIAHAIPFLRVRSTPHESAGEWPSVTVLLTVHNEAAVIRSRLDNLLDCDYPPDRLGILVASDGSTDATNDLVREYADRRVRLFESPGKGKTATQNDAIATIHSDVIAFTDADIRFDRDWLKAVVNRFSDPRVGAVDGRLLYGDQSTHDIQACQGFYWRYELKLRDLESRLGILAVLAGACFAIRRSLFVPMDPSIGEDCIVPLDIVSQKSLVVHEPLARAYDQFEEDTSVTLRRRIRMTLRNWQGTWTRSHLLNPLRHPGYAFALWSHKLLRWLSPVFLSTATVSAMALCVMAPSWLTVGINVPFVALYGLASYHWLLKGRGLKVPGTGTAYGFVLANVAFIIGLWRAMTGHRIRQYRNVG